jgi:RNA polymerase-binding transcription factor DksA
MMTLTETEKLTRLLLTKQMELSRSLHKRDEIVIEKASDAFDEVQLMGERELAIRNLDRDSNALRQIHRALSRIANGTYGYACAAKKISCQSAWPLCHGRPSASSVRKRSIAARSKSMIPSSC